MKRLLPLLFIVALLVALLVSCNAKGKAVDYATGDKEDNFSVVYLFTVDNVKVYRFDDGGYLHYIAINSKIATTRTVSNGKSSTRIDDVIPNN